MNKKRILALLTVIMITLTFVTFALATGDAAPAADAAGNEPAPWYANLTGFLPIILIIAVFYFVLIRPENKRKKETANMRESLKVGDEITTIGGIIGRITKVKNEELTIESSHDRTKLKVMKWAVSTVNKKNEKEDDEKEEIATSDEE